jgi:hypothetical protein
MKRSGLSVVVVSLVTALAASGCRMPGGDSRAAESAVRGQVTKGMTCIQNVDVDGFMALFAPDFKQDGTTKADLQAALVDAASGVSSVKVSYSLDILIITLHEPEYTAFVIINGHLQVNAVNPEDSFRLPETGDEKVYLICKPEGGQWLAYGNQRDNPPAQTTFLDTLRARLKRLHH